MKSGLSGRRRTPVECVAGLGRYLLHRYRGESEVYPAARVVQRNLFRPIEELLVEQDLAIARIVDHAYENSPYYRAKYDAVGFKPGDVKGLQDLRHLPEISKIELAENADQILCAPRESLYRVTSGGTSGVPLTFYRNRRCTLLRRAIDLAVLRYYGWRDGQWQGWLWGAPQDVLQPKGLKRKLLMRVAERQYFFDAFRLTTGSFEAFVQRTRACRPSWLSAYPSLAYDLATRIGTGEVSPVRVPMVSLTAEPTHDYQRKTILEHLAEEVYERYGSRECGMAAIECPAHRGMHIFTESVAYEAVDRGPGVPGPDLIVTDLLNDAMPMIRYHTGDLGDIDCSPCACGRSTPRLKSIQGRETDVIWRRDGSGVAGPIVAAYILSRTSIHRPIQIVQVSKTRIVVRVEAEQGTYAPELASLLELFRREIDPKIEYIIEHVDKIERAASGKYRYVISNITRREAQGDGEQSTS